MTAIAKEKPTKQKSPRELKARDSFEEPEHVLVPTENHEEMMKWIRYARDKKKLVMIIAQNGYGKTSVCQRFHQENVKARYFRVGKGEPAKRFYARFLSELDTTVEQRSSKANGSIVYLLSHG